MLIPSKDDPNYAAEMKRYKLNPEDWGAGKGFYIADTPADRVTRRLAAHFGLSNFAQGRIGPVAQKLLDAVKGVESKVRLDDARADLVEMGFLEQ